MEQYQSPQASGPSSAIQITPLRSAPANPLTFDDLVLERSLPLVVVKMVEQAAGRSLPAQSDGSLLTELQCEV